jgi:hypothetical protein
MLVLSLKLFDRTYNISGEVFEHSQLKKLSKVSNSNETVKCCRLQSLLIQQDACLSAFGDFFTTETKRSVEMFWGEDSFSFAQDRIGQQKMKDFVTVIML